MWTDPGRDCINLSLPLSIFTFTFSTIRFVALALPSLSLICIAALCGRWIVDAIPFAIFDTRTAASEDNASCALSLDN